MNNQEEKIAKLLKADNKEFLANLEQIIEFANTVEKEHKELKELFFSVIDFLPNALWVFNEDGTIYLQNSKAKESKLDAKQFDLTKEYSEIEFDNRFYIIQTAVSGNRIIVSATDNTKSKRHERLISMGQMAAHLAHEIRNPIGSVSLLASTLFNKVDIKSKPIVLEIKKSIWRVERIVKATLLFSKGFSLNEKTFLISDFIEEMNLATTNYSYSKDIEFLYDFPEITMKADFDLLSMVFQNMIFNAIDAIEESEIEVGKIEISYKTSDKHHIFYIYDNGKDFENKEKLFEAFSSTKLKGHGLGLTLSLQIIKAHKGNIDLAKDKKGFIISIPK